MAQVHISGLRDLQKKLRRADKELPKQVRDIMLKAAEPIATEVRGKIPVGPPKGGHTKSDVKVGATQRGAYLRWGRKNRPYAGWLEFGGTISHHGPRHAHSTKHRIVRARRPEGYYVYPTVKKRAPKIAQKVSMEIDKFLARMNLR